MGCTTTTAGDPAPVELPAATAPALQPRPRDLPVAGIDPCSLLTDDQLSGLGVSNPTPSTSPDELAAPSCQWSRFPAEPQDAYIARVLTARGAEWALGSVTGASVIEVVGFPTIRTTGPDALSDRNCLLFVDVADVQSLFVGYQYEGSTEPMTTDLACAKARTAAELMLQTLGTLVE